MRLASFLRSAAIQLWLPIGIFALLLVTTAGSTNFYFPPVADMFAAMWTGLVDGELLEDLSFSLRNIVTGVLIATAVGVTVGLVVGVNPLLRRATRPLLDFARATPTVAFVPVIILSLGIGSAPKVFLISLGSLWPILLNTISGVESINPPILESARSYRIPWTLRLRRVILPGALPQIFAGIRVALAVSVVLMVVSEIYGSPIGLGSFILQSGSGFRVTDTWAGTILIGILGYGLSIILLILEHLSLGWFFERAPRGRRTRRPIEREVALG